MLSLNVWVILARMLHELGIIVSYNFGQADADHIRSNNALLAGLKQRHEKKGTTPILIHTVSICVPSSYNVNASISLVVDSAHSPELVRA